MSRSCPTLTLGKGSAVGTVIPTIDVVIPAAVGVDIGCRMIAARTTFTAGDIAGRDMSALRKSIESAIPLSPGNYNHDLDRLPFTAARIDALQNLAWPGDDGEDRSHLNVDLSHSPKWREQLGSLGGGNHSSSSVSTKPKGFGCSCIPAPVASGNKIALKHIKVAQMLCQRWWIDLPNRDLAYLPQGTPEFSAYLRELNWAQRFAMENRAEMMDRFAMVFADWVEALQGDVSDFIESTVNTHHNYTVKEKHGGRDVWLTRKGAIDAHDGRLGIIPGSMGPRSYIVRGKGNPKGLCSAPHGAGRRFSRAEARRRFTADDLADRMQGIEYRHGDEWVDEIPDAYKDIDTVMADAADLVEVVHELRQVLNVKGTEAADLMAAGGTPPAPLRSVTRRG